MLRQYNDNVVGYGSPKYDNAYFEISYVRAYTTPGLPATSMSDVASTSSSGSATATLTISEAGGMGGPTVVITAVPSANSTIISGSVHSAAATTRGCFVGSWRGFLCVVGAGTLVVLSAV